MDCVAVLYHSLCDGFYLKLRASHEVTAAEFEEKYSLGIQLH